jgi:uncharacterized membrane protein YtjA (UPF0391 family)
MLPPTRGFGKGLSRCLGDRPSQELASLAEVSLASCELQSRRRNKPEERVVTLLKWALIFLVISIVAGLLGFTGISAEAADIARFLFYIFVVIFLVLLVLGLTIFRV